MHLYGQPADLAPLLRLGERRGIAVIEDAAQAHGAEYRGRKAGSLGLLGCFEMRANRWTFRGFRCVSLPDQFAHHSNQQSKNAEKTPTPWDECS